MLTISWSRSRGESSRSPNSAITHTTSPTMPQSWNWYCQSGWLARVWLETSVTTRLPSTGPIVQKPIAEARPTCGEKSRISAGVATRHDPSTMHSSAKNSVYSALLGAFGSANGDQQRR